ARRAGASLAARWDRRGRARGEPRGGGGRAGRVRDGPAGRRSGGGPGSEFRGVPLAARDADVRAAVAALRGVLDPAPVLAAWQAAVAAPAWRGPVPCRAARRRGGVGAGARPGAWLPAAVRGQRARWRRARRPPPAA